MLAVIKRTVCAWCVQHYSTAAAKTLNFMSSELRQQQARVYTSGNIGFKSTKVTKLKKSSSNWLNFGKAVIQHLS